MEPQDTLKILAKVKACWTRQPVDDAIMAEWAEALSAVSFDSALRAVREYRDAGTPDAPTVGEIRALAVKYDTERRDRTLRLPEPELTPEQRERGRQMLRDAVADLTAKIGTNAKARELSPAEIARRKRAIHKICDD